MQSEAAHYACKQVRVRVLKYKIFLIKMFNLNFYGGDPQV